MQTPINHSHLTAKERDKMSFPTAWLLRNKLLNGEILDFGCGYGKDVEELKNIGFYCDGYDNFHRPEYPKKKYDTIICQYVLNVLKPAEQQEVIMQVSSLLKPDGKAFFTVRRDLKFKGFRMHKVHKKTTYQCDVILPFDSELKNDFCEIYSLKRFTEVQQKSPCPFCHVSRKVKYIAENSFAYAIYDGFPVSRGHSLIIPKRHVSDYFEMTQKEQFYCWNLVNFVKTILHKELNPDGFNIGVNIGEAAGQSIFHAHIHLIPRYKGDVKNPKGGVRHVIPGKGYY
ncbi:MAG: bifunctional class I SAM-dependent methyltransferase/HIT family protein [Marinilabilia sp.]